MTPQTKKILFNSIVSLKKEALKFVCPFSQQPPIQHYATLSIFKHIYDVSSLSVRSTLGYFHTIPQKKCTARISQGKSKRLRLTKSRKQRTKLPLFKSKSKLAEWKLHMSNLLCPWEGISQSERKFISLVTERIQSWVIRKSTSLENLITNHSVYDWAHEIC